MLTDVDTLFLAGSMSHCLLRQQIGRPISSLPISDRFSILEAWKTRVDLAGLTGRRDLLISAARESPLHHCEANRDEFSVFVDQRKHRGVAGVIRDTVEDATGSIQVGAPILVVEATSNPAVDVERLVSTHAERGSDITFGMDHDGRYAGCLVLERRVLELVPLLGFFDLKEQLVSTARENGSRLAAAEVVRKSIRIHSLQDWRRSVREWARLDSSFGGPRRSEPSIVDPRATVDDATVIDAIVMEHATVGVGAIIARSVIGPHAVVPAGIRVIDSVYA